MSKLLMSAATAAMVLLAAPVSAQWYVGAGIGSAKISNFDPGSNGVTFSGDTSKTTGKALAGIQFDPNWGLEAQYVSMGSRNITAQLNGASGTATSITAHEWGLAGTFMYPVYQGFFLHAKLGVSRNYIGSGTFCVGATCSSINGKSQTEALFGFGFGNKFNEHWSIKGGYENFGNFVATSGANNSKKKGSNAGLNVIYSF